MLKVKIIQAGKYSDFQPGHTGAKRREAGEMVLFPDWYAQALIKSGQAEDVNSAVAAQLAPAPSAQAEVSQEELPQDTTPRKRGRR